MWYKSEGTFEPAIYDSTSSRRWVYFRRNIHTEERVDPITGESQTVYVWEEAKVERTLAGIFTQEQEATARIADLEEAIAEIIGGVGI